PSAPASQLSSEPHSFSRVFSGAFLDVLAGMFKIGPNTSTPTPIERLRIVAHDAGALVIGGVRLATVGPRFYSQVAAGMIQADHTLKVGRYRSALTSSFVRRGILSPAAAVSLVNEETTSAGAYAGMSATTDDRHIRVPGDNEGYKKAFGNLPNLPLRPLR